MTFHDGETWIAGSLVEAILYIEIIFKIVQVVGLNLIIVSSREVV